MSEFRNLFFSNPRLLFSKNTVRNSLKDIYIDDKGMVNVLVNVYECVNILEEIKMDHPDLELEKLKWVSRLTDEYYIQPRVAKKAVAIWCELFTKDMAKKIADEIVRIKQEEKEAEIQKAEDRIKRRKLEEKLEQYISDLEDLLVSNQFDNADNLIAVAESEVFASIYVYREKIAEKKKQLEQEEKERQKQLEKERFEQEKRLLIDDRFISYHDGIAIAAHVLEQAPENNSIKQWLQDHPRTEAIISIRMFFTDGEHEVTISWKDDDPYAVYTVCRSENGYPMNPSDGVIVCENIKDKKVVDRLPEDKPGVIMRYSVFAVRSLDGQWVKADCPDEAIWMPEADDFRVELKYDAHGKQFVNVSWDRPPKGCAGVIIDKYSNEDDYSFPETLVNVEEMFCQVQQDCKFADYDVYPHIKYRYRIKQIWRTDNKQRSSLKTTREISIG